MPIPISPSGMQSSTNWKENNDTFGVALDGLASAISTADLGKKSSLNVLSESTDADADALLELWKSSAVVSEAESAEEKRYAVPNDFPSDKLMRLKAASLVHGDTKVFKFTAKAARVIKTVVLSESNSYMKDAVNKPYSVIMAEARARSATMSTLAFQKNAEMQVSAQWNRIIPPEYMPTRSTPYIESIRMTKVNPALNQDKQYIVRLFRVNGYFTVIAWNGRNGNRRALTMQPKGVFESSRVANQVYNDLVQDKRASGYDRDFTEVEHPDLLGIPPPAINDFHDVPAVANPTVRTRGRPSTRIPTEPSQNLVPVEKEPVSEKAPEPVKKTKEEHDYSGVLTDADINFTLDQFDPIESLFE